MLCSTMVERFPETGSVLKMFIIAFERDFSLVCIGKELARFQLNSNEMFYMIQMRCVLGYKILLIYHNFLLYHYY